MSLEWVLLLLLSHMVLPAFWQYWASSILTVSGKFTKTIGFCQHLSNEKENFGKDCSGHPSYYLHGIYPHGTYPLEQLACICLPEE